jgi:hypothetical protein
MNSLVHGAALREHVSLAGMTTFNVASTARYFAEIRSATDLLPIIASSMLREHRFLILGKGSNILLPEFFDGIILKNCIKGISVLRDEEDALLQVGAGEDWNRGVHVHLVVYIRKACSKPFSYYQCQKPGSPFINTDCCRQVIFLERHEIMCELVRNRHANEILIPSRSPDALMPLCPYALMPLCPYALVLLAVVGSECAEIFFLLQLL